MSFSAKKLEKAIMLGEKKNLKAYNCLKVPWLCSVVMSNQWSKKICIYFWNLHINVKLKEKYEKNKTKNL